MRRLLRRGLAAGALLRGRRLAAEGRGRVGRAAAGAGRRSAARIAGVVAVAGILFTVGLLSCFRRIYLLLALLCDRLTLNVLIHWGLHLRVHDEVMTFSSFVRISKLVQYFFTTQFL